MRAVAQVGLVLAVLGAAACGDDTSGSGDARDAIGVDVVPEVTPDVRPDVGFEVTPDVAPDVEDITSNGSGTISVAATTITGRSGYLFVALGPNGQTSYCVEIDSDAFVVPSGRLAVHDGAPCSPFGEEALYPRGQFSVSAGIYVPGAETPIVRVERTVTVDGDASVTFDGAALSAPTGDPGRLLLTSTAITGQRGRTLLVLATDTLARLCVTIDADPFTLPPTPMQVLEGNPCGPASAAATFAGGEQGLTGGVFASGEATARKPLDVTVIVDGDTPYVIDGAALSE